MYIVEDIETRIFVWTVVRHVIKEAPLSLDF